MNGQPFLHHPNEKKNLLMKIPGSGWISQHFECSRSVRESLVYKLHEIFALSITIYVSNVLIIYLKEHYNQNQLYCHYFYIYDFVLNNSVDLTE